MTPCGSLRSEVRYETLSQTLIVSEGIKDRSKGSKSSGSSTKTYIQLATSRKNIVYYTMARVDPTLRICVFHRAGTKYLEQHLFVCEIIWAMKNVQDDDMKISQLVTTFNDLTLIWYMKYQSTTLVGQARSLQDIKKALLKELHKPNSELQCIMKLKEIKKLHNELVWDFN